MPLPFQHLYHQQRIKLIELFLTLILLCLATALFLFALIYHWNNDFIHLWLGGYTFLHGSDPYVQLLAVGNIHANESTFINLPWVGLFFVPYALLPFETATIAWIITNAVFLVACLILAQQILAARLPVWGVRLIQLGMLFLSFRTFQAAQTTIILTFLGLNGLRMLLRQNIPSAGIWFGLTIFKPTISFGLVAAAVLGIKSENRKKFFLWISITAFVILGTATLFWPSWIKTYPQVDFRQTFGILENDIFIHYWPVATITDFTIYVLGIQLTGLNAFALKLVPLMFEVGLIVFAWQLFKKGKLELLELCALGALLPAVVSPYIRYYDYIFLSIWLVGFFGGLNFSQASKTIKSITVCLAIFTFLILPGTHPEPWVYLMPVGFSLLTFFVLITRSSPTKLSNSESASLG